MKRGKIVLTPFPFTHLKETKIRPAVIVSSSARKGNDVIIAFISSSFIKNYVSETDLVIESSNPSYGMTGLKTTSILKLDKLATVSTDIILGELGQLDEKLLYEVNEKLKVVLDLH